MLRFLFFVGSVMMAGTSIAEGASTCPVDSVPIQVVKDERDKVVKTPSGLDMIHERWAGPVTTLSAFEVAREQRRSDDGNFMAPSDPLFDLFVRTVTEHVAALLSKENLCPNSTDRKKNFLPRFLDSIAPQKRSLLQFVHLHLYTVTENPFIPVPPLKARISNGCQISSPWIDIAIERKPVPWVSAVVRWNERQFFVDQAMLAGAENVPPGVVVPLKGSEFVRFVGEYAQTVLNEGKPVSVIEESIPPDILWLLRSSPQTTHSPFGGGVGSFQKAVMKKEGYTRLVLALIDRCLASDGSHLRYDSILDVGDLISLEQYKINDESLFWPERNAKVGVSRH